MGDENRNNNSTNFDFCEATMPLNAQKCNAFLRLNKSNAPPIDAGQILVLRLHAKPHLGAIMFGYLSLAL
ncbi:MAG: hypothetical protein IPH35_21690 [Rhodoferax sp.]|nr:hypothetical protein [Rhodoferax sp.]